MLKPTRIRNREITERLEVGIENGKDFYKMKCREKFENCLLGTYKVFSECLQHLQTDLFNVIQG